MPKKIALFSDGTGNSSAKAEKTNVWRLFQALDQTTIYQIAKYDDGVGTSSNKYLAALGGAFGWGLKRIVIDLYKFVCRNYSAGDEIYGFGFSRGAFTIRVLVGLIAREGLIPFRSEEELNRNAAAAYRDYRFKAFPSWSPIVWICRRLRDAALWVKDGISGLPSYRQIAQATKAEERDKIPIRFLGLWDTVEAYGMPIASLKRGIDWVLWPMVFGDLVLSPTVQRACHALSLDDERATFHPLLWDEVAEASMVEAGTVPAGRITQVWFAGVHSNVGGGYPEDQLSLVTLDWMIRETVAAGLFLEAQAITAIALNKSPYARLYDSRSGLASYYRYSPRRIDILVDSHRTRILPIIHGSVLMRMAYGSDGYAPITPPHEFWVFAPNGTLLPMARDPAALRMDKSKSHTAGASAATAQVVIDEEESQLRAAIDRLGRPDREAVRLVWDTVFWRRCLYTLTVGLTVVLVAYPLLSNSIANSMASIPGVGPLASQYFGIADNTARGPISTVVDAFSGLIPKYAQPWKKALHDNPLEFALLVAWILISLAGSGVLEGRIHDRARLAWHQGIEARYHQWALESRKGVRNGLLLTLAVAVVGIWLPIDFGAQDSTVRAGFALLAAALVILLVLRTGGHKQARHRSATPIRSTFALLLARTLRDSRLLQGIYNALANFAIPIAFALLLVVAGGLIASRVVFDAANSAGRFCRGTSGLDPDHESLGTSKSHFRTDQLCWASGLVLEKDHRYLITVTMLDDWFDQSMPADVIGLPTQGLKHIIATPLKRWWGEEWFKPVARVGRLGNEEYVLEPIDNVSPRITPPCVRVLQPKKMPGRDIIDQQLADALHNCDPTPPDRMTLRAEIQARSNGELFLYVNDAVLGVPRLTDLFYLNNRGRGIVSVQPTTAGGRTH